VLPPRDDAAAATLLLTTGSALLPRRRAETQTLCELYLGQCSDRRRALVCCAQL
jgi:hypothetical protein